MGSSFTPGGDAGRFLLRHARRRDLVVLLLLVAGVALTDGIGVLTLVPILGRLQSGGGGAWSRAVVDAIGFLPSILDLLLAMVALAALRAALTYGKQVRTLAMQNAVIDALRARSFGAVLHAEWRWLVQRRGSDHANLIITNVARIALGFGQLINAAAIAIVVLGYLAAAFLLSWRLALLTIALGALVLALFAGNRARSTRLGYAVGQANRALHGYVAQAFDGIRVIKAYGVEDRQIRGFARALADLSDQGLHNERNGAVGQGVLQVGGAAALAAVLGVGHLVLGAPLPTLLPLLLVFARLAPMLGSLQTSWSLWRYARPAVTEMQAFLAEIEAAREPAAAADAIPLMRVIELRGVGVDFAGRALPALDDVTLTIPANSTTALCGASGAGKSTLADLLMGLIAPTRGQLLIDGRALDGAARIAWRAGVAYVQQDAFLFHDTIRANILLGRAHDDAAIARALHRAGAAFVLQLPAALDTIVGDAGMRLSGGERQRIALARALVGSPALLILDEATSALDPAHEQAVRETMRALRGEVTLLFISHRESMREDADQIVFLRGGRVVPAVA